MMATAPETALANVESEAMLLGKMMTDNRSIDRFADILKEEDFSEAAFGNIFSVIIREHSLGRPANPVTLRPYFADGLKDFGGVGFLATLTGSALIGLVDYRTGEQIAALAARRRLAEALKGTIELVDDPAESIEAIINSADAAIVEATHRGDPLHQPTGAQCLDEVMATMGQPVKGVQCHVIPPVDKLLGSLRPKQLTILAARPGMGKTAVAISYALGAAQAGHGVLFVSLEMSSTELGARMAADLCFDGHRGVPFGAIRDGNISQDQLRKVSRARDMLADLPFQVIDASSLTIGRLSMIVRRYKRRMAAQGVSLDLVIVDYLQLVAGNAKGASRYETVSEVSRGMKALAKEHGVSVMALAQLNRDVEKRSDRKPQLSDLKESGQLEQDADNVLFLLRDEYYHRKEEPEPNTSEHHEWQRILQECQGKIDFILAKARNSVEGNALGHFHGVYQAVRGAE